ncbi:MAG: hypothetical protein IJU68_00475 [Bacteroidales bacterium]|nr:hypothetical protein [Bacteroidales bacterium]
MKKIYIFAALALAALVSCNKEMAVEEVLKPETVKEGYVPVTLTADCGQMTKSTIEGTSIVWAEGDEVAVFADGTGEPLKFTVSEVTMEEKKMKSAKFSGAVPEGTGTITAVYPFSETLVCEDGVVTLEIPAEQEISEEEVVDPKAMPSVAYYSALTEPATFLNAMALLKFNVGELTNVSEVTISLPDEFPAGPVTVVVENEASLTIGSKCDKAVTVKHEDFFVAGTDYYAVVAPFEAGGITVKSVAVGRSAERTSATPITLERNKGLNLGNVTEKVTWKYSQIWDAEQLVDFLAGADTYTEDDVVTVCSDLNLAGVELVSATTFAGTLDGDGYKIRNWTSEGTPLFTKLTGTVQDLTIDASCQLTPVPGVYYGTIAGELTGKVIGCVNRADIIVDGGDGTKQFQLGGIVGHGSAGSYVEGCSNYGNIEVSFAVGSSNMSTQYVGGVIGVFVGPSTEIRLLDCANYADHLSVIADNTAKAKAFRNCYIGGVVGGTGINKSNAGKLYGTISGCTNEADVTVGYNGGTGGVFDAGGIIGYGEVELIGCVNNGDVTCACTNEKVANCTAPNIGGIAGALLGTAAVSASDCINNGGVTVSGIFHNSDNATANGVGGVVFTCIGGCFGVVGQGTSQIKNCSNNGKITTDTATSISASSTHSVGGITGYTFAAIDGCENSGEMDVVSKARNAHFAGIAGYCKIQPVTNCTNKADIYFSHNCSELAIASGKTTTEEVCNAGGIVGYAADVTGGAMSSVSGCVNEGDITLTEATGQIRLGGVSGMHYGTADDCANSGAITLECVLQDKYPEAANHVGGIIGYHNRAEALVSNCSNTGPVSATLVSNSGTTNVGGVVGNYQKKNAMKGCFNTAPVTLDANGASGIMRVAGVIARTTVADSDLTGLTNSGDITLLNFASTEKNSYVGGVLGIYQDGDNDLLECYNTGNVYAEGPGLVRAGGLCGALYGSFTDCATEGSVELKGVYDRSFAGGLAGYGSASLTNVSVNSVITVSGQGKECPVGLLFAVPYREYTFKNVTLDGSITGENLVAGILCGALNDLSATTSTKSKTILTLGDEGAPFTIKATANINGTPVIANPSADKDLIANLDFKIEEQTEDVLVYKNVVVE